MKITHMDCNCLTRRHVFKGATGLALATTLGGCSDNELGRSSLVLFSDSDMTAAAANAWEQLRTTAPQSDDLALRARVLRVGADMVRVSGVGGDPEFLVIEDSSPNAFVLPGAKVGVHTGLLDLATNDDELAAVLGHEMGHVVAQHANERASQQSVTSLAIGVATGFGQDQQLERALGLGAELGVLLPYSRQHELEADRLGVRYAAGAGYDPRGALSLWDKLAEFGSGASEFLSTHPRAENRKAVIAEEISRL